MWYWIFRAVFMIILKLFFRFKVEGLENLPQKTNFIVVANHTSFLDPLCIMVAIPRKIHCIVARYLYRIWWLRWFLRKTETIATGSSSKEAISLLEKNKVVGLFPEGSISRDGKLRKFRRGVALLAKMTGRPVVPCAIVGAYKVLPWWARFPKLFLPLKVKIASPIYLLKEFNEAIDDLSLQQGTLRIRRAIEELLNAG
jgi:1-acyl-sn-glycerol-3-phosphate acyltransferase